MRFRITSAIFFALGLASTARAEINDRSQDPGWISAVAEAKGLDETLLREESDRRLREWSNCLDHFADNASIVDADPTDLVVRISLLACDGEERESILSYARLLHRASMLEPSASRSIEMSQVSMGQRRSREEDRLLVRVSYARQIAALEAQARR